MNTTRTTIISGLALGALALSACGSPAAEGASPADGSIPMNLTVTYDGSNLRTDLPTVGNAWYAEQDFTLSDDTNERLYAAKQQATENCMRERGFDDFNGVTFPKNAHYEDRVNPLDRDYAETMGYHALPVVLDNDATAAEYEGLEGTDSQPGCASVAAEVTSNAAVATYIAESDIVRNGLANVITGFEDSDTGRSVESEWSNCMSANGRGYTTREDAWIDFVENPDITDAEIETRLLDLDCDIEVGHTQAQHDWEAGRIDEWRTSESVAIASLVQKRTEVELQLPAIETAVYGTPQN